MTLRHAASLITILILAPLAGMTDEPGITEVGIQKFRFTPREITIQAGEKVRWINREKRQYHSVWFEQLGEPEPDYLFPGDIYERRFDEKGDFPYRCGPHPEMTGIIHAR